MFMLGEKVFVKSCARSQLHLCRKKSLRQTGQLSMHIFFARLFVCGLLLLSCCTVVVLDTFGHFSCLHFVCELTGYSTANGAICGAAGERGVMDPSSTSTMHACVSTRCVYVRTISTNPNRSLGHANTAVWRMLEIYGSHSHDSPATTLWPTDLNCLMMLDAV